MNIAMGTPGDLMICHALRGPALGLLAPFSVEVSSGSVSFLRVFFWAKLVRVSTTVIHCKIAYLLDEKNSRQTG